MQIKIFIQNSKIIFYFFLFSTADGAIIMISSQPKQVYKFIIKEEKTSKKKQYGIKIYYWKNIN